MIKRFFIWIGTIYMAASLTITAEESIKDENKRLYGRFEIGAVAFSSTDQLFALSNKNKITDTLDGRSDDFLNIWPIAAIDLRYTLQKDREIYLGTPFLDDGRGGITLGMTQSFDTRDFLDVSVFAGGKYVWKDPYLLHMEREKTEAYHMGCTVEYRNIRNTDISLMYRYKKVNVADDVIGERINTLKRDGMVHTLSVCYEISMHRHNYITPGFSFSRADMDGESNSYNSYIADLSYSWEDNGYALDMMCAAGRNLSAAEHPLYMRTREEDVYYGSVIFTIFDLFDIEGLYGRMGIGYDYTDANINFFDCHTVIGGLSLGFFF